MRCSLKNGFVILLIFFFTPFEGKSYPLFLYKNSKPDRSINCKDLSAMSRVEQSLDSFPKLEEYDKRSHKIVKKQMTASDYKHTQKNKRSAFSWEEISNCEDGIQSRYMKKLEQVMSDSASNSKKKKSVFPALKKQRDLEKNFYKEKLVNGNFLFRRGIFSKKQKHKKINENEQTQEKNIENTLNKEKPLQEHTEKVSEKAFAKQSNNTNEKAGETENKKTIEDAKTKVKDNENTKDLVVTKKNSHIEYKPCSLQEQYKALKSMVGCKMNNYCRFPDIQDNHDYFECESDDNGCIKLLHKKCPQGEIFSSTFLECLKPFFWKLVERQKRSLWKKGKKQYSNTCGEGQYPIAWTDVTHEEGKQFLSELRPTVKPKLLLYHLKVKKAINEELQEGKKEQRHTPGTPRSLHSEISRRFTQKAANIKNRDRHELFPRSFIIRINKKEGKNDQEESVSEDENDENEDNEDNSDDEEDEDEDEETNDETSDESDEEDSEDEDKEQKTGEKSGIKEFFKSAKEAITNKARFNEPADTSFTLDKTNAYSKNKKLAGSEKDSRKILIDADIKVDKALGKTLKRILGKRKDKGDDDVSLNGSSISDRGSGDQMESEQIVMYENLIRNNPRLKRYFLVSLGEREN